MKKIISVLISIIIMFSNMQIVSAASNNASMQKQLDNKANTIIKEIIKPGMSEIDKEKAIYEYIISNIKYGKKDNLEHTAYGGLINNVAVCEGIAKSFQVLLNKVNIENMLVYGDSTIGSNCYTADGKPITAHAWNIVKINGKYYHCDPTWDSKPTDCGRHFFNLPDKIIAKSHKWDTKKYPNCNFYDYEYMKYKDKIQYKDDVYFVNEDDMYKLYKIKSDGSNLKKICDESLAGLVKYNDYLYFINMSKSNRLYRIKINGTNLEKMNNSYIENLKIDGDYLSYDNLDKNIREKLYLIEKTSIVTDKENIEEFNKRFNGYTKWPEQNNVSIYKQWKIKFNQPIDVYAAMGSIYVLDNNFNKLEGMFFCSGDDDTEIKVAFENDYEKGKIYYLVIDDNVENVRGKKMKGKIVMKFTT